jgi:hypothetical protein
MYNIDVRNIDVRNEVRKLASSKPVHAAAGAGVLATKTLRQLPGRLVRTIDGTVTSLPARANGYMQSARAKAADQYDVLADHGKRALSGNDSTPAKSALNGTAASSRPASSRPASGRASTSRSSSSRASSKTK